MSKARERVQLPGKFHAERPLRRWELHDVYEDNEASDTGRYHCGMLTRNSVDYFSRFSEIVLCEICQKPISDNERGSVNDDHGLIAHAACSEGTSHE